MYNDTIELPVSNDILEQKLSHIYLASNCMSYAQRTKEVLIAQCE